MAKCKQCGRRGLFLRLDAQGLCPQCAAMLAEKRRAAAVPKPIQPRQEFTVDVAMPMVSRIPLKQNNVPPELRMLLYDLVSEEGESVFIEYHHCSHDDGKRGMSLREAATKIEYFSDRLFERAGNARRWVNACTDPQKYFENYDLYVDALQKLTHLERFAVYHEPLPSVTLSSLLSEKTTCEMNMIARAWESNTRAACSLKSPQARMRKLSAAIDTLKAFQSRMEPDSAHEVDRLAASLADMDMQTLDAPAKETPVFDEEKERELLAEYQGQIQPIARHFARIPLISFYYKYRAEPQWLEKCIALCKEDIAELPLLDQQERDEAEAFFREYTVNVGAPDKEMLRDHNHTMKYGFDGNILAFDRLIMIHLNAQDYENALIYCDMAIRHAKEHGLEAEKYRQKKLRIKKKLENQRK